MKKLTVKEHHLLLYVAGKVVHQFDCALVSENVRKPMTEVQFHKYIKEKVVDELDELRSHINALMFVLPENVLSSFRRRTISVKKYIKRAGREKMEGLISNFPD